MNVRKERVGARYAIYGFAIIFAALIGIYAGAAYFGNDYMRSVNPNPITAFKQ